MNLETLAETSKSEGPGPLDEEVEVPLEDPKNSPDAEGDEEVLQPCVPPPRGRAEVSLADVSALWDADATAARSALRKADL